MSKILDYLGLNDTAEVMAKARKQFEKTSVQLSNIMSGIKNNNITNKLMDTLKLGFIKGKKKNETRRENQNEQIMRIKEKMRNSATSTKAATPNRPSMQEILEEMKNISQGSLAKEGQESSPSLKELESQLRTIQLRHIGELQVKKLRISKQLETETAKQNSFEKFGKVKADINLNNEHFTTEEGITIREAFNIVNDARKNGISLTKITHKFIIDMTYGTTEERKNAILTRKVIESIVKSEGSTDIEVIYNYLKKRMGIVMNKIEVISSSTDKKEGNQGINQIGLLQNQLQEIESQLKLYTAQADQLKDQIRNYKNPKQTKVETREMEIA